MMAAMSIAIDAAIAKICTTARKVDYPCYELSPDSFSFYNIKKYFLFLVGIYGGISYLLDFQFTSDYYGVLIAGISSRANPLKDKYLLY